EVDLAGGGQPLRAVHEGGDGDGLAPDRAGARGDRHVGDGGTGLDRVGDEVVVGEAAVVVAVRGGGDAGGQVVKDKVDLVRAEDGAGGIEGGRAGDRVGGERHGGAGAHGVAGGAGQNLDGLDGDAARADADHLGDDRVRAVREVQVLADA